MKLAIYGYDTIVGKLVLEGLEDSALAIDEFYPLSPLSAEYDAVPLRGKNHVISCVDEFEFSKADVALFLTTRDESERLIPQAQAAGCIVVDNSHLFSGADAAPVVLGDVNPYDITKVMIKKLASVPLATTAQLVTTLNPLHDTYGIGNAVVTAMVAVSEHGELGTQTLARETTQLLNGMSIDVADFPAQLAFNIHTRMGEIDSDGISELEKTVRNETASLMEDFVSGLSLTCIQVPTFYGHTMSIHVELEEDCSLDDFRKALSESPAIAFEDELEDKVMVTPVSCAELDNRIYISRIRKQGRCCFDFTCVMDNTRHGEAGCALELLNMIQKELNKR